MEGNLDAIPGIGIQDKPKKSMKRQLATSVALYQTEKETFFSNVCTLFSEILKIQMNSLFIFFVQNVFILFQFIASTFYSFLPLVWDKSSDSGRFMLGLNCILQFSNTNDPEKINLTTIIIPFAINVIIDIFFFSLLIVLKKRGLIAHHVATLATFFFEFLLIMIYLPTFSAFASTFKFIVEKDPIAITFFILYFIIIGFMIVFVKLLSRLISYPSNPTVLQIATYNGQHIVNLLFFEGVKIVLVKITELYDKWFFILVFIIHAAFISYQIYDLLIYPFVHFWCVPFFYGIYACSLVSDILTLVCLFGPEIRLIRLFVPFAAFIIGWFISFFVVKSHYNSIVELLDPKFITELERVRYIEQLPIKNARQATKYIHVGFSKLVPSAVEGWLEILLARQFNDFDLWLLAGNLISFFPCNKAHLEECIEKLSSMHTSSTPNKVLLIRLIDVFHVRDNLSLEDKDSKLEEMKTITGNAISTVKNFWKDISEKNDRIPNSRIYSIAGAIDNATWNWKEVLSLYPNDPNLVENYACFLVECLGKFKTGLKWKIKSSYLQNGYHSTIDPLFKNFLISMPRAWNEHIVDLFGHLQKDNPSRSGNYEMMSAEDQLEKDIDSGLFNKEAERIYKWPRLRFFMTKAVSHYIPQKLRVFQIFKYIAFLAWFILLITITIYYSTSFNPIVVHYEEMEYFNTIIIALNEMRNIIFLNLAHKYNYLYTDEIYHSFLPESAFNEADYLTKDYLNSSDSFRAWSTALVDSFILIYQKISDRLSNENVTKGVESFLVEQIPKIRKMNDTDPVVIGNVSAKSAIISLFWSYNPYSSLEDCNDEYENFLNSSAIFETTYLHHEFSLYRDNIFANLVLQATSKCDKVHSLNTNYIFILIFIPLCIFVPLIIIPLIKIHCNTLKIFKILKSVDADSAKIASQRLSKISKINIDYTSATSTRSKSKTIIILIVLYTFFMIAPFILCIFTFIIMRNSLNYFTKLIDLARYGNQREAISSELFGYIIVLSTASQFSDSDFYNFLVNDMNIHQIISDTFDALNLYNSYFIHGYDDVKGIFTLSSQIRDLHTIDRCNSDLTQNDMHPFYNCIGLERLISTFGLYSSSFVATEQISQLDMKSELFVNLIHLSSSELHRGLNSSRKHMTELVNTTVNYSRTLVIVLLVFSIIFVAANIFIDFMLQHQLLQSLRAVLVLILHLPSPTIAENPSLFGIFLDRKSEEKNNNEDDDKDKAVDPKQIIFNTTQTPIICIGDGFIIETINKAFCNAFDYSNEQLVGKKLTAFIENPLKDEAETTQSKFKERLASSNFFDQTEINFTEYRTEAKSDVKTDLNEGSLAKFSNEEKGAIRMYQKMKSVNSDDITRSKYPIQCICGNDIIINTNVTVYPVRDNETTISNFILKIDNNRQFKEVERKLEDAKSTYNHLQQQLIPRELNNFLKSKAIDDGFSANCVTVVAIRPVDPFDELNEANDKFNDLLQSIEDTAVSHPPLMKVKSLFHILFFIGGLFSSQKENEEGEIIHKKDENQNQNQDNNNNENQNQNQNQDNNINENQNQNNNENDNLNEFEISNENENVKENNNNKTETKDDIVHANAAVEFARDVRNLLIKMLPEQMPEEQKNESVSSFRMGKSKFAIAIITGGPVVCCLTGDKHKSLEIIGDVMDDAFDLISHAPAKSIICTESTKKLINESNLEGIEVGPELLNEKTYLL